MLDPVGMAGGKSCARTGAVDRELATGHRVRPPDFAIETVVDRISTVNATSYPARQGYRLRRVVLRDHSGRDSVVVSVGRSIDLNNNFPG